MTSSSWKDEIATKKPVACWIASLAVISLAVMLCGCAAPHNAAAPITLARTIPLPGVTQTRPTSGVPGRIDHMAYDPATQRLFVAALENGSMEVVDLAQGKRTHSISGLPLSQGAAWVPGSGSVAMTSGSNGLLHVFDTQTLEKKRVIEIGEDADNVRYDSKNNTILVSYGTTNGGAIAILNAHTWEKVRDIHFASRPESFQVDTNNNLLFANLPKGVKAVTDGQVAIADRQSGQVNHLIPLPERARNFPMAYDAANQRLFIACRRPARLIELDTRKGVIVAETPCTDDSDDLFYDAQTGCVLVIGGGFRPDLQSPGTASPCSPPGEMGGIDVFQVGKEGQLTRAATVSTAFHARTGLFVPSRRALYLAVPMHGGKDPEIREYILR